MSRDEAYSHPELYDAVFSDEADNEAAFLDDVIQDRGFCIDNGIRILDPSCGSGRIAWRMAEYGYFYHARDINVVALKYLRDKVHEKGLRDHVEINSMSMTVNNQSKAYEAKVSLLNDFFLLGDRQVAEFVASTVRELKSGGLLIIQGNFLGTDGQPGDAFYDKEVFSSEHKGSRVVSTLKCNKHSNERRQSIWNFAIEHAGEKYSSTFKYHHRTAREVCLIMGNAGLDFDGIHDFAFDELGSLRDIDPDHGDAYLIFRKRA